MGGIRVAGRQTDQSHHTPHGLTMERPFSVSARMLVMTTHGRNSCRGSADRSVSPYSARPHYGAALLSLCANACDDDAWEEFVSRVGRPISLTILRTASLWSAPSQSLVEDLVQITYLKLWQDGCRLLR